MTFEVTDAARRDLAAAIRFYNARPGRYGAEVRAEFNRAAVAIATNPRGFSPVDDEYPGEEVREYFIARFGQRVIFRVDGETARVIAVVHATKAPESWHGRVPPRPNPDGE
jgi:plasmid stabilization system protein ParE